MLHNCTPKRTGLDPKAGWRHRTLIENSKEQRIVGNEDADREVKVSADGESSDTGDIDPPYLSLGHSLSAQHYDSKHA